MSYGRQQDVDKNPEDYVHGQGSEQNSSREYTYTRNNEAIPRSNPPGFEILRPLEDPARLIPSMGRLSLSADGNEDNYSFAPRTTYEPANFSLPTIPVYAADSFHYEVYGKSQYTDPVTSKYQSPKLLQDMKYELVNSSIDKSKAVSSPLAKEVDPGKTFIKSEPLSEDIHALKIQDPGELARGKQTTRTSQGADLMEPKDVDHKPRTNDPVERTQCGKSATFTSSRARSVKEKDVDLYGPLGLSNLELLVEAASSPNSPDQSPEDPESKDLSDSIFAAGSWIHEDDADKRVSKIEDFCEISALQVPSADEIQLDENWQSKVRECAGPGKRAGKGSQRNETSNTNGSGSNDSGQFPDNNSGKRQKRSFGKDTGGDDDNDDAGGSEHSDNKDWASNKRLACPFYIHEPGYYRTSLQLGQKYMVCAFGTGFENTSRVKEHLKRVHLLPPTCPRCGLVFQKKIELERHLQLPNICRSLPQTPRKGLTEAMLTDISRKHGSDWPEDKKWLEIYSLLFPDDPSPVSAYFDHQALELQYDQSQNQVSNRDLIGLVRSRLGSELRPFVPVSESTEPLMNAVLSVVDSCIRRLLARFQGTPTSLDGDNESRNLPSVESCQDSTYSSLPKCGGECSGCFDCIPMQTPLSTSSGRTDPRPIQSSSDWSDSGCIDPSRIMKTSNDTNMDGCLEYPYSDAFPGNPYLPVLDGNT